MNEVTRDLTYRLDIVKEVCGTYGWNSTKCVQVRDMWQRQHDANVLQEKFSTFFSGVGFTIFIVLVFSYLTVLFYYWIYPVKSHHH